ncbi:MAG: hypothetical protein OHK0039_38040 [Bacteroidia bacterium]
MQYASRSIRLAAALCTLLCTNGLYAQPTAYVADFVNAGTNPGSLNTTADNDLTGWTEILTDSLFANTWSANQTLPFAFQFYGTAVSQYKVSANGLVTFDVATAVLPGPNTNLPSPALPGNSIACFWDAFTSAPPTGDQDKVYTRVFGTPGSRQLWIKWFSFEYGSPSGNSFNYMACVLEEGSNKVYLVDMSFSANVSNMSTTVGVQQNATQATQYGDSTITFGTANSSAISNNRYYVFTPYLQFPNDVVITSIDAPSGSGCLGATTPVSISFGNLGSNALTGIQASFSVDAGPATAPETIPDTLASGAGGTYTFAATADLSALGNHSISVTLTVPSDGNPLNNSLTSQVSTLPAVAAPLLETFDGGLPATWLNDPADGGEDWRNSANGNASFGPGSVDHTSGTGRYMWVDDSSPHSDPTNLLSPCVDLAGLTLPSLEFWVWSWNADTTRDDMVLHVDIQANGQWFDDVLAPIGAQINGWKRYDYSLQAFAGEAVRVRFRVEEPGSGFQHDVAIDDVRIFENVSQDLALDAIVAPGSLGCNLGLSPVSLRLINVASNPVSNFTAGYAVSGSAAQTVAEIVSDTIAPGDTLVYTFATLADFSVEGSYSLSAYVSASGEINTSNDSLAMAVVHLAGTTAPFLETFDAGLPTTWYNDPNDGSENWRNSANGIAAFGAGSTDHTSGTGRYMWVDDSGPHNSNVNLVSPCIDLSQLAAPQLEFWVWSDNNDSTRDDMLLHLDILSGGTIDTDVIAPIGHLGSGWQQVLFSLQPYAGQAIALRFRAEEVSTGFQHDISLDDVRVFESLSDDVAIIDISSPAGAACDLGQETVTIRIENRGSNPATGITARFSVNGGTPVIENVPGTLAAGDSLSYTFVATANLGTPGTYSLTASASATNDGNPLNDTATTSVVHIAPQVLPILDDIDGYVLGSTTFADWRNLADDDLDWQANVGPTPTSNTGPLADASGSGGYLYLEASGTNPGQDGILCLPCVDLTQAVNPVFIYSYYLYGAAVGGLEVRIDAGSGPTSIASLVGQQQASATMPWRSDTVDLAPYVGSIIQLCVRGVIGADGNGSTFLGDLAIDELIVKELVAQDVTIEAFEGPQSGCGLGTSEQVRIRLRNNGTQAASGITLRYRIGSGAFTAPETLPGTLAAGDTALYTFAATADLSTIGSYTIEAVASLGGDLVPGNDTLSIQTDHLALVSSFPYFADFEGSAAGWRSDGVRSTWALGTPAKTTIQGAGSGAQAWTTGLLATGTYQSDESSWVSSPCFDFSQADSDTWVAVKVWWEAEYSEDGAALLYSIDGGQTWSSVGMAGAPFNWYNDIDIDAQPGGQLAGWTGRSETGNGSGGWRQAQYPVGGLTGLSDVRFRVAFASGNTVQDDGFAFDDFAIGVPPQVDLGPDTLSACQGTVLVAGGLGLVYQWSTGDTTPSITLVNTTGAPITDSLIIVTVSDALGFSRSDTVLVNISAAVAPTVTATASVQIDCFGANDGVAFAQGNGGTGTLAFLWNTNPPQTTPVATGLAAGIYTVSVTDQNGCSASDTVLITQPEAILFEVDALIHETCAGLGDGAILLSVSGGTPPYDYLWSTGDTTEDLTGLGDGAYLLTLTDGNGCVAVSPTFAIQTAFDVPSAVFTASLNGTTVSFNNLSTGGGSYLWDLGDGNSSTEAEPQHTYALPGLYTVRLLASNPCGEDSTEAAIQVTGVGLDADLAANLRVVPNPTTGQFVLRVEHLYRQSVVVRILAMDGREVYRSHPGALQGSRDLPIALPPHMARGLYLLRVETERGQASVRLQLTD